MLRRSRKYTKKIDLYYNANVSDGFGGNTTQSFLLDSVWAYITTLNKFRFSSDANGTIDFANSIRLILRKNSNLTFEYNKMYFVYRGATYTFSQNAVNLDYKDSEIEIIAVKDNDVQTFENFSGITIDYVERVLADGGVIDNSTTLTSYIKTIVSG